MSELDDVQTTVGVIDGLRARIAELEAEVERLKGQVAAYSDILDPRIEALAPDAVAVFPMTSESIDVLAERISSELTERVEEAEAEIERLKVCGTCGLYLEKGVTGTDEYPWCDADDDELVACGTNDSCHFAPSRWVLSRETP